MELPISPNGIKSPSIIPRPEKDHHMGLLPQPPACCAELWAPGWLSQNCCSTFSNYNETLSF